MKKVIKLSMRDKKLMKLPTIKRYIRHVEREINKPENLEEIERRMNDLAFYGVSPAMSCLEELKGYNKAAEGLSGILTTPPRKWFNLRKRKTKKGEKRP